MRYGEKLRAAREKAGLSVEHVALGIGVSIPFYEDVEAGVRLPMGRERTSAVASMLGLDVRDLFAGLNLCACCKGLGWIRRKSLCPGCRRKYGHVKVRVAKRRASRVRREGAST